MRVFWQQNQQTTAGGHIQLVLCGQGFFEKICQSQMVRDCFCATTAGPESFLNTGHWRVCARAQPYEVLMDFPLYPPSAVYFENSLAYSKNSLSSLLSSLYHTLIPHTTPGNVIHFVQQTTLCRWLPYLWTCDLNLALSFVRSTSPFLITCQSSPLGDFLNSLKPSIHFLLHHQERFLETMKGVTPKILWIGS